MKYLFFFLIIQFTEEVTAQKPAIDTSTFKNWASVGRGGISPDGNYVCYTINNFPAVSQRLIVQATNSSWKKEFIVGHILPPDFTNDSRLLIFKVNQDSLCLLTLGKEVITYIPHAGAYRMPEDDKDEWLAYMSMMTPKELVLCNLHTGKEQHFSSVSSYLFSKEGKNLLLETKKENNDEIVLQCLSLQGGQLHTIWSNAGRDETPGNYSFDDDGHQLAFIIGEKDEKELSYKLAYYKAGMDTAVVLANDQTSEIGQRLQIANWLPEFINEGRKIFFRLQTIKKKEPKPGAVKVDIWSYTDTELQSLQLDESKYAPTYASVMDVRERKIIRLVQENEFMVSHYGDIALVKHEIGNWGYTEYHWNLASQPAYYFVSMKDGSSKLLKSHSPNDCDCELSPDGKWIIYYDFKLKNYFSYQLATGITRNITKGISAVWTFGGYEVPDTLLPAGRKWLVGDEAVLIQDNFDIWQIDLEGIKQPLNLTNGYGSKHLIKFEIFNIGPSICTAKNDRKSILILRAFNTISKDMGFYNTTLGLSADPELLSMGPYVYGRWNGHAQPIDPPIKATNSDSYLVYRMSAKDAPNYFVTTDFKKFTPISDVQPQQVYNWMTTQLIHFKTPGGNSNSGILYKPENFDPSRKYPVIFDIYEIRSDELNLYIRPEASEARINIPWFVSHGYLVCTPDIHYKIGEPGASAYNAVASAADYLLKLPWVDPQRIGIQGHSFGGYETNYIVTHTHLFAAACSGSGASDIISEYGSIIEGGFDKYYYENQQGRMGATLWQIPDLYIKNSPIFNADKVSTPLLIFNNKGDMSVSFTQGIEFFTALRRLGKRVWMLQYDDGGHSVAGKSAEDYNTRMSQFFDHYLKGEPAPKWMLDGIPAKMKGIDDGLELVREKDKNGNWVTPGPGLNEQLPSPLEKTKLRH